MEFVRLAAARNKAIDEDKKEYVKECRIQVKKLVEKCRESFGFQSPKEAAEAMAGAAPVVETLLDMVQKFDDFYREAKRERNVLDFNDLEHLALEVLLVGDSPRQPSDVYKRQIQDSVEHVLEQTGYTDVAKAYILYRKQREKIRSMNSALLNYKDRCV